MQKNNCLMEDTSSPKIHKSILLTGGVQLQDRVVAMLLWHWPIRGDKVHAEHDAFLGVLSTVCGDHHHVTGYLRVGTLQTYSLQKKRGYVKKAGESSLEKMGRLWNQLYNVFYGCGGNNSSHVIRVISALVWRIAGITNQGCAVWTICLLGSSGLKCYRGNLQCVSN